MEIEPELPKRRKRGTGSVKNERKHLKTHGLEHTNYRNFNVPAKDPPDERMVCKCNYKCKTLSYDYKLRLFSKFYSCSKSEQCSYLLGNIHIANINRRRHGTYTNPSDSRRQCSVHYTIPNEEAEHIQICKKTFSSIFSLSNKRVQVLVEKKKAGNIVYKDGRGKFTKERKYNQRIRDQIASHIKSFPIEENHYSRKKSAKQYLSPDININRMYKAFKDKYPDTIVKYNYYSHVFHKQFKHLRFGRPRSDTCSTCDLLTNTVKAKRDMRDTQTKLELHQRKAEKAMNGMKHDKKCSQEIDSNTCMVSLDLQQVIFVPTLTHSQMFYSRQLSCYNLCIHVGNTDEAFMCLWDETVCGRGGNEVASCLLKVVLEGHLSAFGRNLIIWSDNCIGQNKNKMLLFAFIFLVLHGQFDSIEQKFLVSGHSYMPCDRDFALIEKRKRVCKVFTPNCVREMIQSTRLIKPFRVVNMTQENFKDVQQAADSFLNTSKLNISKASWLKVTKDDPTKVKIKKTHSELEAWEDVNVLKKGKSKKQLSQVVLASIEKTPRLNKDKLKNLEDMMPYLPEKHQPFYEEMIAFEKGT